MIPILTPTGHRLTGRIRFRINWRRKMVVQVEEAFTWTRPWIAKSDNTLCHRWRDADYVDVQSLLPFKLERDSK